MKKFLLGLFVLSTLLLTGGAQDAKAQAGDNVYTVPTLKARIQSLQIKYDNTGKESVVRAKFTVRAKAGADVSMVVRPLNFQATLVSTNNKYQKTLWATTATYNGVKANAQYVIPAKSYKDFEITVDFNPKQLFTSIYKAHFDGMVTVAGGVTGFYSSINTDYTNLIYVSGEVSPYINSIEATDINNRVYINGVRFGTTAKVSIAGKILTLPVAFATTTHAFVYFVPSQVGIAAGSYQVQIINTLVGSSNIVDVNITDPGTVCPVGTHFDPVTQMCALDLTVLSPNGGENYNMQAVNITWTGESSATTSTSISLVNSAGKSYLIGRVPSATHALNWNGVSTCLSFNPNAEGGYTGVNCYTLASGDYKVLVQSGNMSDQSNGYFHVVTEGNQFCPVGTHWDSATQTCVPDPLPDLCLNIPGVQTTIPAGYHAEPGTGNCVPDEVQPGIKVLIPNGGETFVTGQDNVIKWSPNQFINSPTVKIELGFHHNDPTYPAGQDFLDIIAWNAPNTGTYTWKASEKYAKGIKFDSFYVKITDSSNSDQSDATFKIYLGNNSSNLTVNKPALGSINPQGKDVDVAWTPYNQNNAVGMVLLKRTDANFARILTAQYSSARSTWYFTMPTSTPKADGYYLRVETDDNAVPIGIGYSGDFSVGDLPIICPVGYRYDPVTNSCVPIGDPTLGVTKSASSSDQTIPPNSPMRRIGSYTIKAGETENVKISVAYLGINSTAGLTNVSNLVIVGKNFSTIPINPNDVVMSIPVNDTLSAGQSETYEIYGDVGASAGTLSTTLQVNGKGVSSNKVALSNQAIGQTNTIVTGGVPLVSILSSGTLPSQYQIGPSTVPVITYRFISTSSASTIQELRFKTTGASGAISSLHIVSGGVTSQEVVPAAGVATLAGLNIPVPQGSAGVNIVVIPTYSTVNSVNGIPSNSAAGFYLSYIKSVSGNTSSFANLMSDSSTMSQTQTLVASRPTLSVVSSGLDLFPGIIEIADIKVTADSHGAISVNNLPIIVQSSGLAQASSSGFILKNAAGTVITSAAVTPWAVTAGGSASATIYFQQMVGGQLIPSSYQIPAGTTETFKIYTATSPGCCSGMSIISTKLGLPASFHWTDVSGGSGDGALTGTLIQSDAYPSNSVYVSADLGNGGGTTGVKVSLVSAGTLPAMYQIGPSTVPISTVKLTSTIPATVQELKFADLASPVAVSSISVSSNGQTYGPAISAGGLFSLSGLSIPVPAGSAGVNVVLIPTYSTVGFNGIPSNTNSLILLSSVKSLSNGQTTILPSMATSSSYMSVVSTKPSLTVSNPISNVTINGLQEIARIGTSVSSSGTLSVNTIPLVITTNGVAFASSSQLVVKNAQGITITTATTTVWAVGPNNTAFATITFFNGYQIAAGQTETFSIWAKVNTICDTNASIATKLGNSFNFTWTDVSGNSPAGSLNGFLMGPSDYPANAALLSMQGPSCIGFGARPSPTPTPRPSTTPIPTTTPRPSTSPTVTPTSMTSKTPTPSPSKSASASNSFSQNASVSTVLTNLLRILTGF